MTHARHFKLYKPMGYLSQFINRQTRRKNKNLLGELFDFPQGTMAIGRLDENSEGLLLLTTDGKVSETVRSKSVEKEYHVMVDGVIDEQAVARLRAGVEITLNSKKYQTQPCQAHILKPSPIHPPPSKRIRSDRHGPVSWISMVVTEGKFRQLRKMTAAVGFPTLRLIRVRVGAESLGDLRPGECREVSQFDMEPAS